MLQEQIFERSQTGTPYTMSVSKSAEIIEHFQKCCIQIKSAQRIFWVGFENSDFPIDFHEKGEVCRLLARCEESKRSDVLLELQKMHMWRCLLPACAFYYRIYGI